MKYEKAAAEVVKFGGRVFMDGSSETIVTDYFTCKDYTAGEYCGEISWGASGITCKGYSQRDCQDVSGPNPVYILVCNHF